jgi:hypothetical protein
VKWNNWPLGGFRKLLGAQTLPVWLERAGYFTAHIGKYLNEYGEDAPKVVPPGWTDWYGAVDPTTCDYYGFTINHNGRLKTYPRTPRFYSTDVYTGLAEDVIRAGHRSGKPFFLSLAPNAPHTVARANDARMEGTPAIPPPRSANPFASAQLPRYPNFNEGDVSDKPPLIQEAFASLTDDDVDALTAHYRGRMGSLLGGDDMVADVVRTLKRTGEYDDTVIVYTSDNGWILGEHRLRDPVTEDGRAAGVKYLPYVRALLRDAVQLYADSRPGRLIPDLVAEMARSPAVAEAVRSGFLAQRRAALATVLHRARERGELRRDVDIDLCLDLLGGVVYYRFLITGGPLNRRLADDLTDALMRAIAT